jgi:hypothetical protein
MVRPVCGFNLVAGAAIQNQRRYTKGGITMSVVATSYTTLPDAKAAAAQLVEQAKAGLKGKPTLAILLSTVDYDLDVLVGAVYAALDNVPLWGGTSSSGVFTAKGWITGEKGAATLMLVADRPAGVGVAPIGDDPVAAGKAAATAAVAPLGGPAKAFLTMPAMGQEAEMLAGMAKVAPGVPVVGGASGESGPAGSMRQFANGKVYQGAYSVAALGGKDVGYAFLHGYKPTGKKAPMTAVAGHKLISIGGRPALDVYVEWSGLPKASIMGGQILVASVPNPLVMHVGNETVTMHPVNANEDGSIDTGVSLTEGLTVELMENSVDGMIAEVGNVVKMAAKGVKAPSAVFLSHCAGRAIALGDRIGEVVGQVNGAVSVPWVGFLAFGEQGCLESGTDAHANLSLSALVLGAE